MTEQKYKLTKIESSPNNLRTSEVVGTIAGEPKVGNPLIMFASPITEGASGRLIRTTEIQSLERYGSIVEFKTLNSTYRLERSLE
jgi:hypothetical protein